MVKLRGPLLSSAIVCWTLYSGAPVAADSLDNSIADALARTREYLLAEQGADGTWSSYVEADPRTSAFYLMARRFLGRVPDARSDGIEAYLRSTQRPDGAWEAWPGSGPDLGNTRFSALALDGANSEAGRSARKAAQAWLAAQGPPAENDLFWRYFLAINGKIPWTELPHISPRLVVLPDWFHPNLYDLSFIRISVVSIGLMQAYASVTPRAADAADKPPRSTSALSAGDPSRGLWKRADTPLKSKFRHGFWKGMIALSSLADRLIPPRRATEKAIEWLLERQEKDGSFFSASQTTALAIMALHQIDPRRYRDQIERGLAVMHRWQITDESGTRQHFTDSTN